jgi:ERCC4-related helicase
MNQYISSSHPELNPCVNDTGAQHRQYQKIVLHSIIQRKWLIYALPAVIAVYLTGNICM